MNDRQGNNQGDGIILLVSKNLRDMVWELVPGEFIGHIVDDDFVFDELIELFDELIPFQYSDEDCRTGYFLGKDRYGSLHRIPLMTFFIRIVTNQAQSLSQMAQVSEEFAESTPYSTEALNEILANGEDVFP